MQIKIFLSSDGKHTVQADADLPEADEALVKAEEMYDKILAKYGTKQEQAVKAYATKPAFPNDTGDKATTGSPGVPMCPKHHKPMTNGKYGWYCQSKDDSESKGWCRQKPPIEFARG